MAMCPHCGAGPAEGWICPKCKRPLALSGGKSRERPETDPGLWLDYGEKQSVHPEPKATEAPTNPVLPATPTPVESSPMRAPPLAQPSDHRDWYALAKGGDEGGGEPSLGRPLAPKRSAWYQIADKKEHASVAGAEQPKQDFFAVLFRPEVEGPVQWVTAGLLVFGATTSVLVAALGPQLPGSATAPGGLSVLLALVTAYRVLARRFSAWLWVLLSQVVQVGVAATFLYLGFVVPAVLFGIAPLCVMLSYFRRIVALQAAAAALGAAAMVANVVVAVGTGGHGATLQRELEKVAFRDNTGCEASIGVCVVAPPGVKLVPTDVPSWVTAALGVDRSGPQLLLVAEDDTLLGFVHGERLDRPVPLADYVVHRLRSLQQIRPANDLRPLLWPSTYAESQAWEYETDAGTQKGVVFFVRTDDRRYVTLVAWGPAATFAALQPRMTELAAGLKLVSPAK